MNISLQSPPPPIHPTTIWFGAYPDQVEQSGRLPSHTFLDYTLTYLLFAASTALTLGQLGPAATSPLGQSLNFLDQLQQDNWQLVLFALAGGACLALGGEGRGGACVCGFGGGGGGGLWQIKRRGTLGGKLGNIEQAQPPGCIRDAGGHAQR